MWLMFRRVLLGREVGAAGSAARGKQTLDRSRLPQLLETDLEEKFVRGSGPGGSAVNKNSNCCVLTHKPTGLVIKCHSSRDLQDNRKNARMLLIEKLDELQNGENSLAAQKAEIMAKKSSNTARKQKRLETIKAMWKSSQDVDGNNNK